MWRLLCTPHLDLFDLSMENFMNTIQDIRIQNIEEIRDKIEAYFENPDQSLMIAIITSGERRK